MNLKKHTTIIAAAVLLLLGLSTAGILELTGVAGAGPTPTPTPDANLQRAARFDAICGQLNSLKASPQKLAGLRASCEYIGAHAAGPSAAKGVKHTPPPTPTGIAGFTPYGVLPGVSPPPNWGRAYQDINTWLGTSDVVYAGSLTANPKQGVVVLASRAEDSQQLGEYLDEPQDGPLTIVSAQGDVLSLMAASGAHYTFDVDHPALVRQ